jgi:hypothetical protein
VEFLVREPSGDVVTRGVSREQLAGGFGDRDVGDAIGGGSSSGSKEHGTIKRDSRPRLDV